MILVCERQNINLQGELNELREVVVKQKAS